MGWLRYMYKLSFAILRSAVKCLRGTRSSFHHTVGDTTDIVLELYFKGLYSNWTPSIIVFIIFVLIFIYTFFLIEDIGVINIFRY